MRHHTQHSEMVLMASAAGLCIGGATWLLSEWFHANDAKIQSENVSDKSFSSVFGSSTDKSDKSFFPTVLESTTDKSDKSFPNVFGSSTDKSDKSFFSNTFDSEAKPDSKSNVESESQSGNILNWFSSDPSKQSTTENQSKTPNVQTPSEIPQTLSETPNVQTPNAQMETIATESPQTPTTQTMDTIGPMKETYFAPGPSSPEFQRAQDSPEFETAQSSPEFETAQDSPTPSSPFQTAQDSPTPSSPFQTAQSSPEFQTAQDSPTPSSPFQTQKGGSRKRRVNKRNTRKRKQK